MPLFLVGLRLNAQDEVGCVAVSDKLNKSQALLLSEVVRFHEENRDAPRSAVTGRGYAKPNKRQDFSAAVQQ